MKIVIFSIALILNFYPSNSKIDLDELIEAIAWVETRNNPDEFNPKENAIGYLQIRPIRVDEINRLLALEGSTKRYTHEQAWDKECSIEMFKEDVRLNNLKSPEKIARNWNGGPRGYKKSSTLKYWNLVKSKLKNL